MQIKEWIEDIKTTSESDSEDSTSVHKKEIERTERKKEMNEIMNILR